MGDPSCFDREEECVLILKHGLEFGFMDMEKNPASGFESMIKQCEKLVFSQLTLENCISMYEISIGIGTSLRQKECRQFISKNILSIMGRKDLAIKLKNLGPEFMAERLLEYHNL